VEKLGSIPKALKCIDGWDCAAGSVTMGFVPSVLALYALLAAFVI